MKRNKGMQLSAVLVVIMVVSMVFVPAVSAKAEKSKYDVLLNSYGITVNDFETKITEQYQIGDQLVFSGDFKLDVEHNIDDKLKSIKSKGTFDGVLEADGSTHIEYNGEDFKSEFDIVKIGESIDDFTYQMSQISTYKGNKKIIEDTLEVPKQNINTISNPDDSGTVNALLTKYDLTSYAPPGSIKIYNDLPYPELVTDIALLGTIIAFVPGIGLTIAGLIAICVAALLCIPNWIDVDPENIYVDVFFVPIPTSIYVEVDYLYY